MKNKKNNKTSEFEKTQTGKLFAKSKSNLTVVGTLGYDVVSTSLPKNFFEGLLIKEMELNDEFTMEKLLDLIGQYSLAIEYYLQIDPMKAKAYQNRMEYLLTNKDTLIQLSKHNMGGKQEENEKAQKLNKNSKELFKTKQYVKFKQEDLKFEDISQQVSTVLDKGSLKDDEKKNVKKMIDDDIEKQNKSWKKKFQNKKKKSLRNSTMSTRSMGSIFNARKKMFKDKKLDLNLGKKNKEKDEPKFQKFYSGGIYEELYDTKENDKKIIEEEDKIQEVKEENKEEDNKNNNDKENNEQKNENDKIEENKDLENKAEEKVEQNGEENKKNEEEQKEEKKEEEKEEKKEEIKEDAKAEQDKKEENENKKNEEKKEQENNIKEKEEEHDKAEKKEDKKEEENDNKILDNSEPLEPPPTMGRKSIVDEDIIRKIQTDEEITKSIDEEIKSLKNIIDNLKARKTICNIVNPIDNDNENDNEEDEDSQNDENNINTDSNINTNSKNDNKNELMDTNIDKIPAKFQSTYYEVESLMIEYMNDFNTFFYSDIFEQFSSGLKELYESKYQKYIEIRNEYHNQIKENEYLLENDENLNEEKKTEIQQTIDSLNEEQQHQIATVEDEFNRKIIDKISEFKLNSFKSNSGIQLLEEQVKLNIYSIINDSFY